MKSSPSMNDSESGYMLTSSTPPAVSCSTVSVASCSLASIVSGSITTDGVVPPDLFICDCKICLSCRDMLQSLNQAFGESSLVIFHKDTADSFLDVAGAFLQFMKATRCSSVSSDASTAGIEFPLPLPDPLPDPVLLPVQ